MNNSDTNKKLNSTLIFNILGVAILQGISFFTIPIFTNLLGTANYGLYTVYSSYQSMLLIIMSLQTSSVIAPASVYYSGKERDKFFSNCLTISLLMSAVVSVLVLCLTGPIEKLTGLTPIMQIVMLLHTVGVICVNWLTGKLSYDKRAVANFFVSTGVSGSVIILSLILIKSLDSQEGSYEAYVVGHMLPHLVVGVVAAIMILGKGRSFFSKKEWKFCLYLCLPLIFHAFAHTVLHQCDKIMVQNMISDDAAGIYGFGITFANVINIIYNALNTTWVPFYHDDIREHNKARLLKKTNNYMFLFTSLTIGFVMVTPEVAKLFAGKEYWGSIEFIPILALGTFFTFLYSFPVNFEFYLKKTKSIATGTVLTAIINIVLNILFIRWFGMVGAAIATLISYVLLFVFHFVIVRFIIKEEYHYKGYKGFFVAAVFAVAGIGLFYLIRDLVIIRWIIFGILAIILLVRTVKNRSLF